MNSPNILTEALSRRLVKPQLEGKYGKNGSYGNHAKHYRSYSRKKLMQNIMRRTWRAATACWVVGYTNISISQVGYKDMRSECASLGGKPWFFPLFSQKWTRAGGPTSNQKDLCYLKTFSIKKTADTRNPRFAERQYARNCCIRRLRYYRNLSFTCHILVYRLSCYFRLLLCPFLEVMC